MLLSFSLLLSIDLFSMYLSVFLSFLLASLPSYLLFTHTRTYADAQSFFLHQSLKLSNVRTLGDDTSDESMFDQLNVILGSQAGTTVASGTGIVTTGSLGSGGAHSQGNKKHSSYQ